MRPGFRVAIASTAASTAASSPALLDPLALVADCLRQLGPLPLAMNFGLLYVTDRLAGDLPAILAQLKAVTPIQDWAGTVGLGICAAGVEVFDAPALAVMVAALPPGSFRLFGGPHAAVPPRWREGDMRKLGFGLVHGDPGFAGISAAIQELAHDAEAYLAGGLSSARTAAWHVAGSVVEGGISGVLFDDRIRVAAALTQSCTPLGQPHRISRVEENIIFELDDEPALTVLKREIGPGLARDLKRISGVIYAGLPVLGSDRGDFLVRALTAVAPDDGWVAVGANLTVGDTLLFCRREPASAKRDLNRMLVDLKHRTGGAAQAGVYFSCASRGSEFFGEATELRTIAASLGDVPLIGFFGNGEIAYDRIYGHAGVLALFL